MNYIRIFFSENVSINFDYSLNKKQSHYLFKVMRLKMGDKFLIFNNQGEWQAKITNVLTNNLKFKVLSLNRNKILENDLWLAFSPIKSNYFNFMIQKATELGVTKFFPIITQRSIVRKINLDRIKKIVLEACEQSNRIGIPEISRTQQLKNFLNENQNLQLIFADLNSDKKIIKIKKNLPVCLLVGPEGDFSEDERFKILKHKNVQSIKLSNNILRTETAIISGLSILNFVDN